MLTIFESNIVSEGKGLSYTVAGVTGLLGGPLGAFNAAYQNDKIQALDSDNDFEKTGKPNLYKNNRAGKNIAYQMLGMIPVVGAVTNIMLAMDRWDKLDELEKTKANAIKIAEKCNLKIQPKGK